MLYAHAGIAALGVKHTAVQPLLMRRLEKPVDESSINAGGANDEQGSSSRVVRGDGSRFSGGMLSGLRKNKTKTASHKTRKKGIWKLWRGGGGVQVSVVEGAHAGGRAGSRL